MTISTVPDALWSLTGAAFNATISEPDAKPAKALVAIVHGLGDQSDRYRHVRDALCAAGYAVLLFDLPGHGAYAAARGTLGHFADANGSVYVPIDIVRLIARARDLMPVGTPLILLGHSLGSLLVRVLMAHNVLGAKAAVWTGTMHTTSGTKLVRALATALAAVTPGRRPSTLYRLILSLRLRGRARDASWLTRDAREARSYINNPLTGFGLTTQGMVDFCIWYDVGTRAATLDRLDRRAAYLILSGTDDPIGGRQARGVRALVRALQARRLHVEALYYPGARHEVFNETNRNHVIGDLIAFLDRVTASPQLEGTSYDHH